MVVIVVPLGGITRTLGNARAENVYEVGAFGVLHVADGALLVGSRAGLAETHRRPIVAVVRERERMIALHDLVGRARVDHDGIVRRELAVVLLVVVTRVERPADASVGREAISPRIQFQADAVRVHVVAERGV